VSAVSTRSVSKPSAAYAKVAERLASARCVVLDGGTAAELSGSGGAGTELVPADTSALVHSPGAVEALHRRYAELGCDVISTNTWGLSGHGDHAGHDAPLHWMDLARRGMELGRSAIERAGRAGETALAFSIDGDVHDEARRQRIELLARLFESDPPDLILLETITLVRDELTLPAVAVLVETGVPVWMSFRRCRHGVCGVYGQHWGGPEGDEFGRRARSLEELGVEALLINCLPPDHVPGMLPWLRDFTDLPLGVYPNLGYHTNDGWSFDRSVGPKDYAELCAGWVQEGAQIVGGCCGVGPEHVEAVVREVRERPIATRLPSRAPGPAAAEPSELPRPREWHDARERRLYPLPVPEIVTEPGVFAPTQGSYLVWKHLFESEVGRDARCLDVGCGTGLQAVQLARNGAHHVHAIDLDPRAVANTRANAFRNGVSELVSGEVVDLYPWVPNDRYDVVVASLYQMPVDPYEKPTGERPLDFWGRNLVDHLFTLLPRLLAECGVAYVMQLSILGEAETNRKLARHGLSARVADFAFFEFHDVFNRRASQIERVERLSDAYHLQIGDRDTMVAYLLEISRAAGRDPATA